MSVMVKNDMGNDESTIYSVGHGNKEISEFICLIQKYKIKYLIDIRSKPFSKWNPQFNQPELTRELKNSEITYLYLGDSLGGLPKDQSCYDENRKVVYNIIKQKFFFKEGLRRVIKADKKKIPVVLMCSETNPSECHRSKLIGEELIKLKISINHIINAKEIKSQEVVFNELTKGRGPIDLFGNEVDLTSRKSY